MEMLAVARILLLVAEAVTGFCVLYLCVVAVAAVVGTVAYGARRQATRQPGGASPRFVIVIPAHNEVGVIDVLLHGLATLTYPADYFHVYVIADNCTDQTAAIARSFAGVHVYERDNSALIGKGYALRWMFDRLEEERVEFDACLILDADAVVEPGLLEAYLPALARGARAIQGRYLVLNPEAAPSAALRWIALALANYVRPFGRYSLGASASLTGNGFVLTHTLMRDHPWQAFGLTEDYQYYLSLVSSGVRVHYAPDARILTAMPTTFKSLRVQDVRWETMGAGQEPARVTGWRLFTGWLRTGQPMRLEALIELILPQLSLLAITSVALGIAAALLRDWWGLAGAGALAMGLCVFVASAFILLRPPLAVYRALLFAPWYALRKAWIVLVVRRRASETSVWVGAKREVETEGEVHG